MKKILFFATVFSLILSSYSKDNEVVQSDAGLINFRGIGTKATRGSVTDGTNFLDFKIFAYHSATDATLPATGQIPDYMYNVSVTRTAVTAAWSYSPGKYWPVQPNKISFFAYSPYNTDSSVSGKLTVSASSAAGAPTLSYTVEDDPTKQVDLLYSQLLDKQKQTSPLSFLFSHAMTRIAFSAQLKSGEKAENYTATITEIKITGVKNSGIFNMGSAAWGSLSGSANYTLTSSNGLNAGSDNLVFNTATDADYTARSLVATDGYLFLMPQTLDVGAKLYVKFNVRGGDLNENIEKELNLNELLINGQPAWVSGKSVEYRFTIDGQYVSANVIEWTDGEQGAMIVDGENYLKLSDKDIVLSKWPKSDTRIKVTTNLNAWNAKVKDGNSWLTLNNADVSGNVSGTSGEDISFAVSQYPSATGSRSGSIRITAGTMTFDVLVEQTFEDQEFMLRLSKSELLFPARVYTDPGNTDDYTTVPSQEIEVRYGPTNRDYDLVLSEYSGGGVEGFAPDATSSAATIVVGLDVIALDAPRVIDNPFYERSSILKFTVYDQAGLSTISKQVLIRQINYALLVENTQDYYMQGYSYSLAVKANSPWRAVFESDGNTFENITGDSGTGALTNYTLSFKIKDNAAVDQCPIIRIESPEGLFPTQRIKIPVQDRLPNSYFLTPGSVTPLEFPVRKAYRAWELDRNLYANKWF